MVNFTAHKISARLDKIGSELKQARQAKNINLAQAARELQIKREYLEALEQGQWDNLPAGVYGKNFLREYSLWLGLDPAAYRDLFSSDAPPATTPKQKFIFSQAIPHITNFLAVPRIIKNILIVLAVMVCVAYLGFRLEQIISPPELTILNPADSLTTTENIIQIKGLTEAEAEVKINGEMVLTDANGGFTKLINLKTGLNTITVIAKKKYSRELKITRNIIVQE
jgi:transcriptional regulator with XRE-family HTH domain